MVRNLLSTKNLVENLKNFVSILISITVLISVFSEKNLLIMQLFYINPITCGFVAYLVGNCYAICGFVSAILLMFFLSYMVKKKFQEWPLY